MPDLERHIMRVLEQVHDPCCEERGISVVDMGLVRSVSVNGENARVELMLTSGWCPFASRVITAVRDSVESVPGIRTADVEIVWDEPWTMDRLSPDARRKLVFLPVPATVRGRDRASHTEEARKI